MNYCEQELNDLCDLFSLCYCEVIQSYMDFKASGGKYASNAMKKVLMCIETIPVSNVEWDGVQHYEKYCNISKKFTHS